MVSRALARPRVAVRRATTCRTAFERRVERKNAEARRARGEREPRAERRIPQQEQKAGGQQARGVRAAEAKAAEARRSVAQGAPARSSGRGKGEAQGGAKAADEATRPATDASVARAGQQAAPSAPPARSSLRFGRDFGFGQEGPDVEKLQGLLLHEGLLLPEHVTGYFGRETKDALVAWQKLNRVMPSGYFGPVSRSLANKQGLWKRAGQFAHVQCAIHPARAAIGSATIAIAAAWAAQAAQRHFSLLPRALSLVRAKLSPPPQQPTKARASRSPGVLFVPTGAGGEVPAIEPVVGSERERRVELRRQVASLQAALSRANDELKGATWQLRRERERADRAEALYLEQRSSFHKVEAELGRARSELKVARSFPAHRG